MYFVPRPQVLDEENDILLRKEIHVISAVSDVRLIKALQKLPLAENGIPMMITGEEGTGEGYCLHVTNDGIHLEADGAAGIFYGIQTLRQIFTHEEIHCLHIKDTPKWGYRGFYHDVTRGKVPKVETLKKLIDDMAYYKMNSLQLYVEHTFAFEEFADTMEQTGYLTAEEIRELDDYCYENFIDFIPSLATCGHLYELLQQEKYAHLREIEDFTPSCVFWYERMRHHTIDPTNSQSFELIKSMLDQYLPLFRSDKVNIGGDEPYDLSIGRHKDQDTGRLYIDFMKQIIDYVQSKGKNVMMWADPLILENIEKAGEISDNVDLLSWGYDADTPEERVQKLTYLNNKRIVCPGTSSWFRLVENAEVSEKNISRMAQFGQQYGVDGMLNTNWGDYGNPCSIELSMYGLMVGAEKSWNPETPIDDVFKEAVNHLLYKHKKGVEYLFALSRLSRLAEYAIFVRYYSNLTCEEQIEIELPTEEMLRQAQSGCKDLAATLEDEAWIEGTYRDEMLLAVEGIAVTAELFAKNQGYFLERYTDTDAWLKKYRFMWLKKNKESELREIERMYRFMEKHATDQT